MEEMSNGIIIRLSNKLCKDDAFQHRPFIPLTAGDIQLEAIAAASLAAESILPLR